MNEQMTIDKTQSFRPSSKRSHLKPYSCLTLNIKIPIIFNGACLHLSIMLLKDYQLKLKKYMRFFGAESCSLVSLDFSGNALKTLETVQHHTFTLLSKFPLVKQKCLSLKKTYKYV